MDAKKIIDLISLHRLTVIQSGDNWMVGVIGNHYSADPSQAYVDQETGCIDAYLWNFAIAGTLAVAVQIAVENIQNQKS